VLDAELVERAADGVVDHLVERARPRVEGRHRRRDDRAGLRDPEHVLEVDDRERRLADEERQSPPFLQVDLRRPLQEVLGHPVRDRGEGAHAARGDDHPGRREPGVCERRAQVVLVVDVVGERPHLRGLVRRLGEDRRVGPAADDEVGLDADLAQHLEHPDAVDRPGRP
jgi:hypothetical protein